MTTSACNEFNIKLNVWCKRRGCKWKGGGSKTCLMGDGIHNFIVHVAVAALLCANSCSCVNRNIEIDDIHAVATLTSIMLFCVIFNGGRLHVIVVRSALI